MVQIQDNMSAAQKQKMAQDEKDAMVKASRTRIKHKLLVMSGKGGVGKSSTSVN